MSAGGRRGQLAAGRRQLVAISGSGAAGRRPPAVCDLSLGARATAHWPGRRAAGPRTKWVLAGGRRQSFSAGRPPAGGTGRFRVLSALRLYATVSVCGRCVCLCGRGGGGVGVTARRCGLFSVRAEPLPRVGRRGSGCSAAVVSRAVLGARALSLCSCGRCAADALSRPVVQCTMYITLFVCVCAGVSVCVCRAGWASGRRETCCPSVFTV